MKRMSGDGATATMLVSVLWGTVGMMGCGGSSQAPMHPTTPLTATLSLVAPRYLSPSTAAKSEWSAVTNVCLATTPSPSALTVSRVATLAARAHLPVVAADADCSWTLAESPSPPPLLMTDAKAAALWATTTSLDRHSADTTLADGRASTALYGPTPRAVRYAVDAAFARLARNPSGALFIPAATVLDWPSIETRGVVEGFYGMPFSRQDRALLLSTMDETRANAYIYGPQNDDYAHASWASPYPATQLDDFAAAQSQADALGIDFTWAIRPGQGAFYGPTVPIVYSSDTDFATLTAKYEQLASVGVRHFGLFFDDNTQVLTSAQDMAMFASFQDAQAFLINRVDDWNRGRDPTARLLVVGTYYSELVDGWQSYNEFMRDHVHPTVDFMWTGNQGYSDTITAMDIEGVTPTLGQEPIIWDNWPQSVTALYGRSADLGSAIKGFISNPVICSWSSKPASAFVEILGTAGMYTWRPDLYDAGTALAHWDAYQATFAPSPSPSP